MSVAKQAMQAFLKELRRWDEQIKKSTYAHTVTYEVQDTGDFKITVHWKDKTGKAGSLAMSYTRESLFPLITAGRRVRPSRRPCQLKSDIIAAVLKARGV